MSIIDYGQIAQVLARYHRPVKDLSNEQLREIVQKLKFLKTHVYEITRKLETCDEISMDLTFVEEAAGLL